MGAPVCVFWSLIGGGILFSVLLSVTLSITVLTNEVLNACDGSFLVFPGEYCLFHFPRWMIHRSLCPDNVPDIAQRQVSRGPRPVAYWSHCEVGQYLTSYVSL